MRKRDDIISYTILPRVELIGNTQCVVDGLKCISEYKSDKIRISLGDYCVSFFGANLRIDSFSFEGAIICGDIVSMEFDTYG